MRRATIVAALAVVTGATLGTAGAPAADAAGPSVLAISGHGYGHGRGMGQWGAYGYALDGWSAPEILAHYYGGTTLTAPSAAEAATPISVDLDELTGAGTITVGATGGGLTATWAGGRVAAPSLTVTRSATSVTVDGQATSGDVTLSANGPVSATPAGGATRSYQGSLVVKAALGQVWDVLPLDQYVAGVVPAESPASWGVTGEAALEAQAVAARSYALAWLAASGGAICDTTSCQVYDGDQDVAGDPAASSYTTYSDQAVAATSGQLLRCVATACGASGAVAFTEFSSSTGGWTAGGDFPAVVDAGDATPSNPNHDWTTTVTAAQVEAAWPQIGTLSAATVTSRNGLGDMGGRVLTIDVSGTAGSVSMSGDAFAAGVGLRSDWFAIGSVDQPSGGLDGYWVLTSDGDVHAFGSAPDDGSVMGMRLDGPVQGMAPTVDQGGYWIVGSDGGIFSFGDARFYGSTGGMRLNAPVLGMAPTATGAGYWLFAGDGGIFSFGDARFYGSTGGMHLNAPIVGMASTPDGGGYWLVASDGGIFSFGDARFYGSTGGMHLNAPIAGMVPAASGTGYTLVARDGGVFTFGSAGFYGSLPGIGVSDTVESVAPTADGAGYLVLGQSGDVYSFGDAPDYGGLGGSGLDAIDIWGRRGS